ncbi:MAG: head GIN domain-containing protein [Bacteroidales bacterium]|nr:head GIN domain-containing protein [Bacteroidales bacterium]
MKTMKFNLKMQVFVVLLMVFQLFSACSYADPFAVRGSGNKQVEERNVRSFVAIDVSGGFEVILKQGSAEALTIEADDNLMKLIVTEVRGGELKIYTEGNVSPKTKMKAYVTFVKLDEIDLSGAVKLRAENKLTFNRLSIEGSGASDIELDLSADRIEADLSGASKINLSGSSPKVELECSGASKIYASGLEATSIRLDLSGASYAEVFATESLIVDASGASTIRYKGNPERLVTNTSGASKVSKF